MNTRIHGHSGGSGAHVFVSSAPSFGDDAPLPFDALLEFHHERDRGGSSGHVSLPTIQVSQLTSGD